MTCCLLMMQVIKIIGNGLFVKNGKLTKTTNSTKFCKMRSLARPVGIERAVVFVHALTSKRKTAKAVDTIIYRMCHKNYHQTRGHDSVES